VQDFAFKFQGPGEMLDLFRRKPKRTPSRRMAAQEGYTIQESGAQEVPHAVRLARLTPEESLRLLQANDRPVRVRPGSGTPNES
jgi:hypothetical protein